MKRRISITLPWPPTVNTYWRHVVIGKSPRVLISKEGREYRVAVARQVQAQRVGTTCVTGRLVVEITAYPPDRRARDLDNLPKGVLDSLRHAGVFRDDSDIDELHIRRDCVRKGGELHITIAEISLSLSG